MKWPAFFPILLLGPLCIGCINENDSGAQPDTKPPDVVIVNPASGAAVTDNTVIVAQASDNVGVVKVEIYVDGLLATSISSPPWQYGWNVLKFSLGSTHVLQAVAYDAAGNIGSSVDVPVMINKSDVVPPTVSIVSPSSNTYVCDQVLVSADPRDNLGVAMVEFYIDGTLMSTVSRAPWQYLWNTVPLAVLGTHSIFAKAYDGANNVGSSAAVSVTIKMGNREYSMDYATVGLWHLNEGGNRVSDASVGYNAGTVTGTSVVVGRFFNARNFFGATDNIRIKYGTFYMLQNFTVEAWVRNESPNPLATGSTLPCIVGMVDGSATDGGASLGINPDLTFVFNVRGTSGPMSVGSISKATVGQWVHVAATRIPTPGGTGTTLKLLVNGIVEASRDFPGNQPSYLNTTNIYFGNQGDSLASGARRWIGLIDEIRFSNRERSYFEFDLP